METDTITFNIRVIFFREMSKERTRELGAGGNNMLEEITDAHYALLPKIKYLYYCTTVVYTFPKAFSNFLPHEDQQVLSLENCFA